MPKFSISDAAKRAGVERTTLYRKLNKGEISAEIDPHGNKVIDALELLRIYPEATVIDNPATGVQEMRTVETQQNATVDATMTVLLREAEMREEKIEDMKRRIEALEADKTDLRSERDRLLKVIEEQSASVKLLTEGDRKKAKTGRRFFILGVGAEAVVRTKVQKRGVGFAVGSVTPCPINGDIVIDIQWGNML